MLISLPQFDVFGPSFGLSLRQFRSGDESDWLRYLKMPEVSQFTDWRVSSLSELLILMQPDTQLGPIRFALVGTEDDRLVGTIGFLEPAGGEAEIAYDLTPGLWGKGIASAACNAVSEWGLDNLGLQSIKACVKVGNRASARVLEKCRFRLEGTTREIRYASGQSADYWIYRRLAAMQQAFDTTALKGD